MSGLKLHVDVYTTEKGIIRVELKKSPVFSWTQHGPAFQEVDLWLENYAAKKELPELPFDYSLVSEFSKKVLIEMQKISFGKTQSYKELGHAVNCSSARAIGRACAMNPIPLFIPCHRVIGSNGKLTGFAYGVDMKEELLLHEGKLTRI